MKEDVGAEEIDAAACADSRREEEEGSQRNLAARIAAPLPPMATT